MNQVTHPVVSRDFDVYFWYSIHGRPSYYNYPTLALPISVCVLLHLSAFKKLANRIPKYRQGDNV